MNENIIETYVDLNGNVTHRKVYSQALIVLFAGIFTLAIQTHRALPLLHRPKYVYILGVTHVASSRLVLRVQNKA